MRTITVEQKTNDAAELEGKSNGECSIARSGLEKENMKLEVRKRKESGQRS